MTGPTPDKPPKRCNAELVPNGEYPWALPEGGEEILNAAPECTCAEDREGGDPDDHSATCPWANYMDALRTQ